MAVNNKPFNINDRLDRTEFKGRPNIFSAQDLNRYLDALRTGVKQVSEVAGGSRENWTVTITNETASVIGSVYTMSFDWAAPTSGYAYYKGLRFELPSSSVANISMTFTVPPSSSTFMGYAYFVLVATKEDLDFTIAGPVLHIADAKEYCSVSGTDSLSNAFQLPASDNTIYGDERIVATNDLASIVLLPNEEVIGIIATYKIQIEITGASSVIAPTNTGMRLLYNMPTKEETMQYLQAIVPSTLVNNPPAHSQLYKSNGSAMEALIHLIDQYRSGQCLQDKQIRDLVSASQALFLGINQANSNISTLQAGLATEINTRVSEDNFINARINGIESSWVALPYTSFGDLYFGYTKYSGTPAVGNTQYFIVDPSLYVNTWSFRYKKIGKTMLIEFFLKADFSSPQGAFAGLISSFKFEAFPAILQPRNNEYVTWKGDYAFKDPSGGVRYVPYATFSWSFGQDGNLYGDQSDLQSRYRLFSDPAANAYDYFKTLGIAASSNYALSFTTSYELL
jgi:hypothetical protein